MRYKSQENAVFIAIHPTTYRGGGFLTHGVLNVERLDAAADNYEQRLRRVSFYEKNGICRTGYGFSSGGVDYSVLASDTKNFDPSECKKLFGGISLITE